MTRRALLALCLIAVLTPLAEADQLRILIINARSGKPVANECLNISFGAWHGADVLASSNHEGIVVLDFEKDHASAESVPESKCASGWPSSKSIAALPTAISLLPNWYVSCQYSKTLTHDPSWQHADPSVRIPWFSVQEILSNGIAANNSCSHLNRTPKPGELVLFVRKRTFWEGMRS